ncbi:MAG: M14 family zinc carboxypeptidase [Gaiellaceae bacterium]
MRKLLTAAVTLAIFAGLLVIAPASDATGEGPVADTPAEYTVCARVYADPHAYWPSPAQAPGRSPFAKGTGPCQATDFITYPELKSGMEFMAGAAAPGPTGLFPQFLEFFSLERDFGGADGPCSASTDPADLCSAGLPQGGVSGAREKSELYMIRVTDERVPNAGKKHFVFPLSIHGIERAGAEAGVRAAEDLATWAYCEAQLETPPLPSNGLTQCGLEGAIPHPLLETQPATSIKAGEALKKSVIYFVFANPDGWRRGDPDNLFRFYQRYNGNGVDMNRDWPTLGFTHRPYTPWSEPETRSFGKVLKSIRNRWDGGIDLHGQLIDRAFSFTLLGASQRDFAKDRRILQTVKGAYADAESRLAWSPAIKPNSAPPQCTDVDPGDPCDNRVYGVQWGTVWDTIAYQVTGSFGDWIDSPLGLGADGIDNEMSLSHLSNCGIGSCYLTEAEQLHVDGNKSLVYAMINFTLLPEDNSFDVPGKVGYVLDPTRLVNPGNPLPGVACDGLPPQPAIPNQILNQANNFRYQFVIKGAADGFCNGGVEGVATPQGNLQGVGGQSTTSLILERFGPEEPPVVTDNTACAAGDDDWEEVNRYFNQSSIYLQAGQAVHGNQPTPGTYRICVTGTLTTQLAANGAFVDLDISFTTEKAWEDPGQLPYNVSNMDFFAELAPYMAPGQLVSLNAAGILNGTVDLSQYRSVVIADNAFPGVPAGQEAAWGAKLKAYVQGGGNLVLTDGALRALAPMAIGLTAGDVSKTDFYAGFIAFTNDGGSTATYADPLAKNINQPGAAEGPSHRHQTYEPVPLGMDLGARQSCSGAQCTAPIWTVTQSAWQAAGGRTVGQTGGGRTNLGELPVGQGVVRVIGALLPMPTEAYYHPFGLASYALTYTGFQVLNNALQWGPPTAVGVSRFGARWTKRGVSVSWRTAAETQVAGFNVWRSNGKTWRKVNRTLVPARRAGRTSGAGYTLLDRSARRGPYYTYRLQLVDLKGRRDWHGPAASASRPRPG